MDTLAFPSGGGRPASDASSSGMSVGILVCFHCVEKSSFSIKGMDLIPPRVASKPQTNILVFCGKVLCQKMVPRSGMSTTAVVKDEGCLG